MLFIRPAIEDDFKGYEIEYDFSRYMSDDVKELIEEGNFRGAIGLFRKQTGIGLAQIKSYCEEYRKYVNAKRDFENGKPVFVSY